jgi:T-complex protein 1 subunit beta
MSRPVAGIMSIEHADFDGIERLALVLGGEIASTFDDPKNAKLGHCKQIEEIMIGEDKLIHFSGEHLCTHKVHCKFDLGA